MAKSKSAPVARGSQPEFPNGNKQSSVSEPTEKQESPEHGQMEIDTSYLEEEGEPLEREGHADDRTGPGHEVRPQEPELEAQHRPADGADGVKMRSTFWNSFWNSSNIRLRTFCARR